MVRNDAVVWVTAFQSALGTLPVSLYNRMDAKCLLHHSISAAPGLMRHVEVSGGLPHSHDHGCQEACQEKNTRSL